MEYQTLRRRIGQLHRHRTIGDTSIECLLGDSRLAMKVIKEYVTIAAAWPMTEPGASEGVYPPIMKEGNARVARGTSEARLVFK